ncbi:MAG TPA: glycosyltransferase family 4 protein [Bryobacteraceae bacterium]|jgi:glycosyltransferase involved in cell wall biosynthesis|nr:glycosyltransferase family 4 protein [Bryobacteraceae bacterium]
MTGDTVGGVWTFTIELARALAAREIEVVLATLGARPSAAQIEAAACVPGLCVLGSDYRLEWMEDPWADVEASGKWLMQIARDYSPDLVHLNSFGHGALPWRAPTVLTAHSCVLSWWGAVRKSPLPPVWNRYRTTVKRSLAGADLVTAPSSALAHALVQHYGVAECRVIANGCDASRFQALRKEPLVFTAGRAWDEAKNIAAVAGVAPRLSWPVYVAGDAGEADFPGCRLLGRLGTPEMAEWYGRAAIYALPARYEPFGLSILEAALSGCALVVGDIPSLREIWADAAILVPPEDTVALREALEALIADAHLREEMALLAYTRAIRFNAETMGRRYLRAYLDAATLRKKQCVS